MLLPSLIRTFLPEVLTPSAALCALNPHALLPVPSCSQQALDPSLPKAPDRGRFSRYHTAAPSAGAPHSHSHPHQLAYVLNSLLNDTLSASSFAFSA